LVLLGFSLAVSFACLAGIEGALRLAGFGGHPTTFVRAGMLPDGSSLVLTDARGPGSYFFSARSPGGSLDPAAFVSPKPPGGFRVFVVGESAAKGSPQPQRLSGASFLREMLADAMPGRDVEVINLGTTAIGAFPVLGTLREALGYEADLVVVYTGNNEFYGACGVASLHSAGRSPAMIRLMRATRSTAIAQAMDRLLHGGEARLTKTLMETMVGRSHLAPDDPARGAAARNLETFVGEMVDRCAARGVPVVVCTLPCNERDLAPLGEPDMSGLARADQDRAAQFEMLAREGLADDPAAALAAADKLLALAPSHATGHHLKGLALHTLDRHDEAAAAFRAAVDLDPMPWRAPAASVEAVRRAAERRGAVVCDLQQAFREHSPGGSIGWELMDDHVHPSLRGQELVARTIVRALAERGGTIAPLDADAAAALPGWEVYAERLGRNEFDAYAAAHAMRLLGEIPFFAQTNPELFARADAECRRIEAAAPSQVVAQLRAWRDPATHAGGSRPITGMAGRGYFDAAMPAEAERLFWIAARSVTPYTSWDLQYTYFALYCRRQTRGSLDAGDLAVADEAIGRGEVLLSLGHSSSGAAERYVAELHLMCGEATEAIPYLAAARAKLPEPDRVLAEESLVRAYVATGATDRASAVIDEGIARGGPAAARFLALRAELTGGDD
jgi:tetratricopeptide (TPR) repeat protein